MRLRFLLLVSLVVLLAWTSIVGQTRSVVWERWDVIIDNIDTSNNHYTITEIYDLSFTGTFRFGQREIDQTNLTNITNIFVKENGRDLIADCSGTMGTFCVTNTANGVQIKYIFRQTITNARQNFEIGFTVEGALRSYDGGDQLWWTAIPSEHFGFPILQSTITVNMPQNAAPREGIDPVKTYGARSDVRVNGATVVAQAIEAIQGNQFFEIRVQYPHNPSMQKPPWQDSFDRRRNYEQNVEPLLNIGFIAIAILIVLGGPLGLYALWYTKGRDPKVGLVPEYLSEPPSDLPPAVAGSLVDEEANVCDVLSTLVDLATRGYLVFEEDQTDGLFGFGKKSEFTFKQTDKSRAELAPFERNLMNKIFDSGPERTMESLKNKFYQYIPMLQDDLYDELVDHGLFTTKPSTTRKRYRSLSTILLFLGVGSIFLVIRSFEDGGGLNAIMCIPASIFPMMFAMNLVARHMPAKTLKGAEEAAKWDAFQQYLENLDKYDSVEGVAKRFEQFLPYAVAFGIDRSWIRRFSKIETVSTPIWYFPTYRGGYEAGTPLHKNMPSSTGELARASGGGSLDDLAGGISGGLGSISDGLTEMLDSAARTFTSQPSSSGGSGSWGSGGSSFSGGGSFGGGSSGGGSSGFG